MIITDDISASNPIWTSRLNRVITITKSMTTTIMMTKKMTMAKIS